MAQTADLLITVYVQRVDTQRTILQQMEVTLQTPAAPVMQGRLRKRQALSGATTGQHAPAHPLARSLDRFLPALDPLDDVPNRDLLVHGSIRTGAAAPCVTRSPSLLRRPTDVQQTLHPMLLDDLLDRRRQIR